MHLYNPETFDPAAILPPSLRKFSDDARYIIHKLCVGQVINRQFRDTYMPLKASYLRRIISERNYQFIKNALIKSGTILTDGRWVLGKKSIGYMLGKQYKEIKNKCVKITNKRLIRKLSEINEDKINAQSDTHKHLCQYLQQIKIDYDDAVKSIHDNLGVHELSVSMIHDKRWYFIHDAYGRVHTNLSNLKSSLRNYLKLNDKNLVNLDICNSQPLFLGVLLILLKDPNNNIITLPHPLTLRCDILDYKDVKTFVDLVQQGEIYEYLAKHSDNEIKDRKRFKHKLFTEIFFCKNNLPDTEYSILFQRIFPTVYGIIKNIKRNDYTVLAKILQRTESDFVIGKVVNKCMKDIPEMPIFTIHDSIMTTHDWLDILQGLIMEEFRQIGVFPKLRVEHYGNQPISKLC